MLLAAVLWYADGLGEIRALASGAVPQFLLLALAVMTVDRLLMTFKWILLLETRGLALPLFTGFKIYCAAMIWGMFLPTTVGADALRAYLTSRHGLDGYEVTASIIVERLVGFVGALLLGLVGMLILSGTGAVDERFDPVWWAGGATLCAAIAAMMVSFNDRAFDAMLGIAPSRLRASRLVRRLRDFHAVYRAYGDERATLGVFFALTMLEQGLTVVGVWVIALGLGVDIPLWFVAAAVPVSMLIARLPIAFDGLGVFEGVFVLIMSLGGVRPAEALSIALAGRVLQIAAWAPWWLLYSLDRERIRPPKPVVPS